MDRTNWTDYENPVFTPYTAYTGLDLTHTFLAFLLLTGLHLVSVFVVKVKTVHNFRNVGKLEKLRHCLENMNIPVPFRDWDLDRGEVWEYLDRRRKVNREMFWLMLVNFVFNLTMLTPLLYTGSKIIARHQLLRETIGARSEEDESYWTVIVLMVTSTAGLIICTFTEWLLYDFYNKKFHPAHLIVQETEKEKENL